MEHRFEASRYVLAGGSPTGDADAHGAAAVPVCRTSPTDTLVLDCFDPGEGFFVGVECGHDLIEGYFVEDLDAVLTENCGEGACVLAAAIDHVADSVFAEGEEGSPGVDASGAAGAFRGFVHGLDAAGGVEVAGGDCHCTGEGLRVSDEGDAAVVGDVEPFVAVGSPGVGIGVLVACAPEAESAVDVHPGIGLLGEGDELVGGIHCARIDIAGLEADEGGLVECWKERGVHAALRVGGDFKDAVAPEAEHGEGLEEGAVTFFTHYDGELGGVEEALGFDVVVFRFEQGVPGGGHSGE